MADQAALLACQCAHSQERHVEGEGWCGSCYCDRYRPSCGKDGCFRAVPCQIHGPFTEAEGLYLNPGMGHAMSAPDAAALLASQHALAYNGDCQWTCPHPDHARHDMSGETQRGIYGHRITVCPACGMKVCVDCDVKGICRPASDTQRGRSSDAGS